MKNWRRFISIGFLAVFAFALAGCPSPTGGPSSPGSPDTPNPSSPVEPGESPVSTYGISLSQTDNYLFLNAIQGYETQGALTVTVTNTGNQATGTLTVALSGASPGSFTLSPTTISSISVGDNSTFTVTPNTGLPKGGYSATVTVSGGNGISASFTVVFDVLDPGAANFSVTNYEKTYNGGSQGATVGYAGSITTAQAGTITVYYTGTGGTTYAKSTTAPANAGTYSITVTTTGGTTYNPVSDMLVGTLAINRVTPVAPNAPGVDSKTLASVTLTAPTGGDPLHSYLAMEYARNSINSAPASGWQDGLTFSGLTAGTTYYFFARYKADTAKNNVSAASTGLQVTNDFNPMVVTNTDEWNYALTLIKNGGNGTSTNPKAYTITVSGNVAVPGSTANSFGNVTNIAVTLNGSGKLYLTSQGSLLTIGSSQTVCIDSAGLTLQGLKNGQNGSSQDNNRVTIYVNSSGKLELRNGTISGNTNSFSGGGVWVYDNGTFEMSGGKISGNITSGGVGGGVWVYDNGTFEMSGGEISGNTTSFSGGGVAADPGSIFTMNGGKISGNTAPEGVGGGVIVSSFVNGGVVISSGTFTMSGGEISGNTASNSGGGVALGGNFTMSGGEIFGNTAFSYGGGVDVGNYGTFTKNGGGTIYGYTGGDTKSNVVKNSSGVVQSNSGHAVYVESIPVKRRETTAGPGVNLDSNVAGASGGWEN